MGEKFETRLMEIMNDHPEAFWETDNSLEEVCSLPASAAVECVRQMLSEFMAGIYQP
jgi:hypothetical protein